MIIVKQSNDYLPLSWKGVFLGTKARTASFTCSKGHTLCLRQHAIADDGTVTPSVVCPIDGCTFHEWIKLDKWSDVCAIIDEKEKNIK